MKENKYSPSGRPRLRRGRTGAGGIEEQLWNYIDGLCTAGEKSAIENLLKTDVSWHQKYKELLELHRMIHSSEMEQPTFRFSKNVMEAISKHYIAPATKTYINKKIIWGIGIFFISLIAGFLIYAIGQIDWSVSDSGIIGKLTFDYNKINYSKIFSTTFVNVLMMINVLLGLLLLDRFLADRKNRLQKDA